MNRTGNRRPLICAALALALIGVLSALGEETGAAERGLSVVKGRVAKRVALVIGNNEYANAPLKNAVNDAKAMSAVLASCGFDVADYYNADRRETKAAIRAFQSRLRSADVALVYFSGHGIQVEGVNYLVPVGADVEIRAEIDDECVRMDTLMQVMAEAEDSINVLILDACRNNPFRSFFRSTEGGLSRMRAPKNSIVIYATAPDSVASDGDGANGLFTEALMRHIQESVQGEPVEVTLKKVRGTVAQRSGDRQIPWTSSSLTRDFSFNFSGEVVVSVNIGPVEPVSKGTSSPRFELTAPGEVFDKDLRLHWLVLSPKRTYQWGDANRLCKRDKAQLPSTLQLETLAHERDRDNMTFMKRHLLVNPRTQRYWSDESFTFLLSRKAKVVDISGACETAYTTAESYFGVLGVRYE